MAMKRLSESQRAFFTLVKKAIQANPFSKERSEYDRLIAGGVIRDDSKNTVEATLPFVRREIELLEKERVDHLKYYNKRDAALLTYLFVYDIFHQFIADFDTHITLQQKDRNTLFEVPFAKESISRLLKKGFSQSDSLKFFAFFFQMRRAYFFIEKNLIGTSRPVETLRIKLWNNIFTHDIDLYNQYLWERMEDFPTLILGKTGTGKGNAAMSIGKSGFIPFDEAKMRFSENFSHIFVALNLSQFSEALIESELFGHVKGAFTGAIRDKEGVLSTLSPHGSVFLDEIGDISPTLQIKLLKVIEEREFSPVGSKEIKRFKGRIIAATNVPANDLLKKKLLRDDFYYRLCSDVIEIPTLKERLSDNPDELTELSTMLIKRIIGKDSSPLTQMVLSVLKQKQPANYPWPGNVRELGQCIRQIILNQSFFYQQKEGASTIPDHALDTISKGEFTVQALTEWYCAYLYEIHENYGTVAGLTGLDRRTVKKYADKWFNENLLG